MVDAYVCTLTLIPVHVSAYLFFIYVTAAAFYMKLSDDVTSSNRHLISSKSLSDITGEIASDVILAVELIVAVVL